MIITRKIQIVVNATGDERKEYIHQLYTWRDLVRKAANMIVSHKFIQQNIRDFGYVQEDIINRFIKENPGELGKDGMPKFFVKDILKKEKGNSEQNVTYRVASSYLKGKCPAEFFTCLNQAVGNAYKEKIRDFLIGKASIPSYKNIPIPFPGKKLQEIVRTGKETTNKKTGEVRTIDVFRLDFYHIPLELYFGRDRSNNRIMVERALAGEYKFCGSSLMIDDESRKMYFLVSIDIPVKETKTKKDRILYATLGYEQPLICSTDKNLCTRPEDTKGYFIGNKDEFLYQRIQIQAALRRLQATLKYTKGGHGRSKKLKALDRYHEKEKNYIDTKTHLYSCLLVKEAIKQKCGTIYLANYKAVEEEIERDEKLDNGKKQFLLRNWGYHNLASKIEYKAAKYGIAVIKEKP